MDRRFDVDYEFLGVLVDMFPGTNPSHLSSILKRSQFDLQLAIEQLLSSDREQEASSGSQSSASEAEQVITLETHAIGEMSNAARPEASPHCTRLVVLVGVPGSGKSTFAAQFAEAGWAVVCQDVLGNRRACEEAAAAALAAGQHVLVDRTNIDAKQRAHWVRIAHEHGVDARGMMCVHFDTPPRECERRVLARTGHPTLPPTRLSAVVVRKFQGELQRPREAEGFALVIVVRNNADAVSAARAVME
jgi:predicted kinase